MGCNISINIHEDHFDRITDLILLGLQSIEEYNTFQNPEAVIDAYKCSVRTFMANMVQRDVLTDEVRQEPERIANWSRLEEAVSK